MADKCPGKQSMRQLDSVVVPCPDCERLVEFFTDEPKRRCRCGRVLLRETLPQCAEWCLAAEQCLGQAIDLTELQKRVEEVKNDPRAKKCLETIQERLKKKKEVREEPPPPKPPKRPEPQEPDRIAQQKAIESLCSQSDAQLEWLGAQRAGSQWRLPVLNEFLQVQTDTGEVFRDDGQSVRSGWRILVLHYLDVRTRPPENPPAATFASFPSARTYASVYENRVNRRLCATVGKDLDTLRAAANVIEAREVQDGDVAFEVNVFPRIPIRLIWYAGDEELPPACTLLLPTNIDSFLCTEDIVVLSESFVSRLCGKPY